MDCRVYEDATGSHKSNAERTQSYPKRLYSLSHFPQKTQRTHAKWGQGTSCVANLTIIAISAQSVTRIAGSGTTVYQCCK